MRKTKIIATIGPASENPEVLENMIAVGMNVARLNFSHGSHDEHAKRIALVRAAAKRQHKVVGIMLDTKGPEIRTGKVQSGKVLLKAGQQFILTNLPVMGNEERVSISYANLVKEVKTGDAILMSDGLISLLVTETTDTDIVCQVANGGELGDKKGINVPGIPVQLPFMSEQDRVDIEFGIDQQVDFIAASFVSSAEDILVIRRLLEQKGADISIIAKIESQQGVRNLDDIIKVADGVMVARGDLGVEIPAEEVPLVQRKIVKKCCRAGKIVIIATQMLESMIVNPRPTRAEVSDVATAVFESADAIMLSGETASGHYPVAVVETMARVAERIESALPYMEILRNNRPQGSASITDAIGYACCSTAMSLHINTIISITHSGYTSKMLSKYRPQAIILAATSQPQVINKMSLVWGVYPMLISNARSTDEIFADAVQCALKLGYVEHGDKVILTAGLPASMSGATNMMKVHVIGEILVQGVGIGHEPASGMVKLIKNAADLKNITTGDIVITAGANADFAPYLSRMGALIAETGGLTSDAAILGLNANIPVVVDAKDAMQVLEEGMVVTVDTLRGCIYKGQAKIV